MKKILIVIAFIFVAVSFATAPVMAEEVSVADAITRLQKEAEVIGIDRYLNSFSSVLGDYMRTNSINIFSPTDRWDEIVIALTRIMTLMPLRTTMEQWERFVNLYTVNFEDMYEYDAARFANFVNFMGRRGLF